MLKNYLVFAILLVVVTVLAFFGGALYRGSRDRGEDISQVESLDDSPDNAAATDPAERIEPGLRRDAPVLSPPRKVAQWRYVPDFPEEIAVFETVFWDPRDTESLRDVIRQSGKFHGKTILEIGTGSGLLSLCCLKAGAERVVATDVNPAAIDNVKYNARLLGVADRLDARLVSTSQPEAFAVIGATEKFDIIISNPPWEDQPPTTIDSYALYDERFVLLRSLIEGLKTHIEPGGGALLAYGCVEAIEKIHEVGAENGLTVLNVDSRELDTLPAVFLPGMLVEVTP